MKDETVTIQIQVAECILDDMRAASDAVDAASGTSEHTPCLIALALLARHFLREYTPVPNVKENEHRPALDTEPDQA